MTAATIVDADVYDFWWLVYLAKVELHNGIACQICGTQGRDANGTLTGRPPPPPYNPDLRLISKQPRWGFW